MDKKTLSDLDYYTVRDEISGFCVSEEGKYSFLKTEPYTDLQKIENAKQISKEWMSLLSFTVTNPLSSWPEVFEILKILKIQGPLRKLQLNIKDTFSCKTTRMCKVILLMMHFFL